MTGATRAARVLGAAAAGTMAVLGLVAPAEAAVTSIKAGWWTSSPFGPDADVPPDGMSIQAALDPADPVSYGAVEITIQPGDAITTLELVQAPSSVSTAGATLAVCPLTSAFAPAQGGDPDDAPSYDCTTNATSAAADGSFTFDLAAFPPATAIALAVVPTDPGTRVVVTNPTAGNVALAPAPPQTTTTTSTTSTTTTTTTTAPPAAGPPGPPATAAPPATASVSIVPGTPSTTVAEVAAPLPQTAPPLLLNTVKEEGSVASRIGFASLVCLIIGLWLYAGRPKQSRT